MHSALVATISAHLQMVLGQKAVMRSALVAAVSAHLQMVLGPGVPRGPGGHQQAHVQHQRLLRGTAVGEDSRQQQRQHCHAANSLRLGVGAVHCPESLQMGTGRHHRML